MRAPAWPRWASPTDCAGTDCAGSWRAEHTGAPLLLLERATPAEYLLGTREAGQVL
jgi:hypothetical protein